MKRRRHVPSKAELLARLPQHMRPKLTKDQRIDLGLAHVVNLELIRTGEADDAVLWQYVGGVLTWSRVADLLQSGQEEMRAQLDLASDLVARYGRTGRVLFTGPEYQLAKLGMAYMDDLAEIVDQPTASLAADWSERQVSVMAEGCRAGVAA
jgi:hypothetical protein